MTIIYAHRGASGNAPENTMDAFLLAIANGANGIELDVHLSKDNIPVVMHDETLDRTSNGKGYLKDYTYEELKKFDCNNHMLTKSRCVIPSLEEVIILAKKNNILLNIEIKTDKIQYENIERIVCELVMKYDYQEMVIYSSFNPASLMKLKEVDQTAICGFLYNIDIKDVIKIALVAGFDGLHPQQKLINKEFMKACKENELFVNTWTVNAYEDIERQYKLQVDGIITNYPARAREIIG